MKAATSSVATMLGNHPAIFSPRLKEPNFFAFAREDIVRARQSPTLRWFDPHDYISASKPVPASFVFVEHQSDYEFLYQGRGNQRYALDASTTYLSSPIAAKRIASSSPNARIIALTRDPAQRAWAEFKMNQRIGLTDDNFIRALDRERDSLRRGEIPFFERYALTGLYDIHLERFRRLFDNRLLVLKSEASRSDPQAFVQQILRFLELSDENLIEIPDENVALLPRFAMLNRILHETSLKYRISAMLPSAVRNSIKSVMYSKRTKEMPTEFSDVFPSYLAEARLLWKWG